MVPPTREKPRRGDSERRGDPRPRTARGRGLRDSQPVGRGLRAHARRSWRTRWRAPGLPAAPGLERPDVADEVVSVLARHGNVAMVRGGDDVGGRRAALIRCGAAPARARASRATSYCARALL